jgi:hypothetical protein
MLSGVGKIRTRDQRAIDPLLCNVFFGSLAAAEKSVRYLK